ncbi:MAG: ABC transporter permease [Bacilli bacterium]
MVKKKTSISFLLIKKLLRSAKENWKQFLSIIAISFLAVCLFSGLTSNALNFQSRVSDLYSETNFADIYITTTGNGDLSSDKIMEVTGVETAEERTYLPFNTPISTKSANLIIEDEDNTLSQPKIINGTSGFLIMNSFSNSHSIFPNDYLNMTFKNYFKNEAMESLLYILSKNVLQDKTDVFSQDDIDVSCQVTGTMYHPEGIQSSDFSSSVAVTNPKTIQKAFMKVLEENYDVTTINTILQLSHITGGGKYTNVDQILSDFFSSAKNQILVTGAVGTDLEILNENIKDKIKNEFSDVTVIISTQSSNLAPSLAVSQDVDQAMKLTYVFPVIFFLVSVLVILTTLSQMIMKERTQIGCLKAVGVKKGKIYFHYISYGFLLCFIGGVLGFFIGPLLLPNVMEIKYNLLWDIPSSTPKFFHVISIIITLSLLLLASLVSFLVSHSVISEKPVDTLRAKAPKHQAAKSKPGKITSHISIPIKMAFRNIFKDKVKTVMVILGTLGCTALLVCGFGIMDTLNYGVSQSYSVQENVDITVSLSSYKEAEYLELTGLDNVQRVEKVINYPVSISTSDYLKDTYITMLEDDSSCFNVAYSNTGLTIDQTTAEALHLSEGDIVTLSINNEQYEEKVEHIFETSLLFGVFVSQSKYSSLSLSPSAYWITVKDHSTIESTSSYLKENYNFSSVRSQDEMFSYANDLLSSITTMTNVVKIFAILLSIVVIYNLTSLNISERARVIATMKVLGFNFKEISKTIITEIIIDTLVGSFIGLFLGFPMCYLVLSINKTTLLTFLYHINITSYIIAFGISVVTALLVNIILCLRIKKIKMVESLKSVE